MKNELISERVRRARAAGKRLAEKRKGPRGRQEATAAERQAKRSLPSRGRSNTRRYEDMGDNDGMQDAVNPKPKFKVSNVEDPKKIKRKAPRKIKKKDTLDMTAKERGSRAVGGLKKKQNRFSAAERKATLKKTLKRRKGSPGAQTLKAMGRTTAFDKKDSY